MNPHDDNEIHNTISRNAAASMLANTLYLVTRLVLPPFILHYVSLGEYGLWSYCFILIGYISMGAFGVSSVYVRYVAYYAAHKEIHKINSLISTGIIAVSTACLLIIPILWILLPQILSLFNINQELYPTAFNLIFFTTVAFLFDLSLNVFSSVLQSVQKFVLEKSIWTVSYMMETFAIIIFLALGLGIYSLFYAYALRIAIAAIFYGIACYRVIPGLSLGIKNFDRKYLVMFYHFGGIIQLSGILATINRSIEKVIAGLFIGPTATALFDIGKKFPSTAIYLPSSVNAVLLPATSHLHAYDRHETILDVYFHGSRWVNMLAGIIMGFLAAFASPIIVCWLGNDPKYEITAFIMVFFTIACQMDVMTGPGSAIFRSINRPRRELIYPVIQLALYILGTLALYPFFGVSIASITLTISSMTIVSVLIYVVLCNRFFGMNIQEFFKKAFLPGLTPYLFGFLSYWLLKPWFLEVAHNRWETFALLCFGLVIYLSFSAPFIYFILCESDERASIRKRIEHVTSRLTK